MCARICREIRSVGIIAGNAAQNANHAAGEDAGDFFKALVGEIVGGIGAMGHRHAPVEVLAVRPAGSVVRLLDWHGPTVAVNRGLLLDTYAGATRNAR